ncbi:MAG TPA: M61 family peptidase [Halothiobacillaceae bacterium]|nr:M61 family peptidase [Halothiobacillaceae bacterium]
MNQALGPKYQLSFAKHRSRYIQVQLSLPASEEPRVLSLPNWIFGSYLIRDFARHLMDMCAQTAHGHPVALRPIDQHSWTLAACSEPVTVRYQVYCADFSVRTAHVDADHVFFNGTSVFLQVHGAESLPHQVVMQADGPLNSRVATTMPAVDVDARGFGCYQAAGYAALIDYPVEIADFIERRFEIDGVPHRLAFTNALPNTDFDRIAADIEQICRTEIALFGGAPFSQYLFLIALDESGFGGLEHADSTALIFPAKHLPALGQSGMTDEYQRFLSLCAHEYFHNWNVKRIKPAAFAGLVLDQPAHTRLLWLFEGFTSYFDDWLVRHAGLIDQSQYLKALQQTINRAVQGPGWHRQTLEESSFYAWTRFYQQDENAINAIVSYYTRGAVVALLLDLYLRSKGKSLLEVIQRIWSEHADTPIQEGRAIEQLIESVAEEPLGEFFDSALRSTEPLALVEQLAQFGVHAQPIAQISGVDTGLLIQEQGDDGATVRVVIEDGPAAVAGIAAGDKIIAVDGFAVNAREWSARMARYRPGDQLEVHLFRQGRLRCYSLLLKEPRLNHLSLKADDSDPQAVARRNDWLAVCPL